MAKEKMVFFRSAIGGFNRADVNSYIEKLNADFTERERLLKKKIDALDAKCNEFESVKNELELEKARATELEKQLESSEIVIEGFKENVDAQAAEIERLKAEKLASESEINELSERIESLSEAICKSEKYDDISAQIGEIILSAKQAAETIVSKAEKEAEAKRAEASEHIESAASSFNARAATAAYAVKNQIKKLAHDSYAKIAERAAETSDMLRSLAAHISGSSEQLDEELSSGNADIETTINQETAKVFSDEHRISFK